VKGLLIATGAAGLVGLYDWMADAFNCSQDNKRFPLVDTPKLFDEAMKVQAWNGIIASQYDTQFNPDNGASADIARAFSLYSSVVDVGGAVQAWTASPTQYAGLTATDAKEKVAGALLKTLSIYSNCPVDALGLKLYGTGYTADPKNLDKPPVELQTRAGYIKLLRDVVDNTHSTWVEGITEQRNALSVRFGNETAIVLAAFDKALKSEDAQYKRIVDQIK
jgi:hypothetical protein